MKPISYRKITEAELHKMADIDRSERIHTGFEVHDGRLIQISVDWDVPDFYKEGDGQHSIHHQIALCKGHLAANATTIGAFDGEKLAGIGILTPEIRPRLAQLAYLQVSKAYRRKGIAREISRRLLDLAREQGAENVYVSATPSESAVGFYKSLGFTLIAEPLPELFAIEPEDIHMILKIN